MAGSTPTVLARRVRTLSDRAVAWLFIAPTVLLLLAINIFPLIWTIYLSFTNYKANRPNAKIVGVGTTYYADILSDPTSGTRCRRRTFRLLDGPAGDDHRIRPCPPDQSQVPRPRPVDDRHPAADDVVARGGRQFLEVPLRAADRTDQQRRFVPDRRRPVILPDAGEVRLAPWAIVIVDVWM